MSVLTATTSMRTLEDLVRRLGGVLVEKAMGLRESRLAAFLIGLLNAFVVPKNPGVVLAPDGAMEIMPDLVRIPDVAFLNWDRMSGRQLPTDPVPQLVPNLTVEVLSRSNTPGEMAVKRQEYFAAGVELVWEIDPVARTVAVYTSAANPTTLGVGDSLTGGVVLPGFSVAVSDLFAELDRQG